MILFQSLTSTIDLALKRDPINPISLILDDFSFLSSPRCCVLYFFFWIIIFSFFFFDFPTYPNLNHI